MEKNQQAYWDKVASGKEFTTPFQMKRFKSYVDKAFVILDVGCGYGRTLNELDQEGFKNIYGIDWSQKMIEKGKRLYPGFDLKKCTAGFPFNDNTFDAVLLIAVLTCIAGNKDQMQIICEIERVLKPRGILYINDFLINQDTRNLDRYDAFKAVHGTYGVFELDDGALLRHHAPEHLFDLTRNFETKVFQTLVYTTMNQHTSNGCCYIGQLKHE